MQLWSIYNENKNLCIKYKHILQISIQFFSFYLEIVCSPPRIPNGNFRPQEDNYIVGDIITIQCNPGYHFKTLTGKSTAECTKNGWVPDPGCVRK